MEPPPLHLEIQSQSWPLSPGAVIGRLGTVATEELKTRDVVSRQHLLVDYQPNLGGWTVTLLPKVRNATHLNGQLLQPGVPVVLKGLNELSIHSFQFHLRQTSSSVAPVPLSHHPIPLLNIDLSLEIQSLNPCASQLFGSSFCLQPGDHLTRILTPSSITKIRQALIDLPDHHTSDPLDLECESSSASTRWLRATIRHQSPSFLLVLSDITNRVEIEHRLHQHHQLLTDRLKTLTDLISSPALPAGDLPAFLPLVLQLCADLIPKAQIHLNFTPVSPHQESPVKLQLSAGDQVSKAETLAPAFSSSFAGLELQILQPKDLTWDDLDEHHARLITQLLKLSTQLYQNATQLQKHQQQEASLKLEFAQASHYLSRLLPAPLQSPQDRIQTQWEYHPSGVLGGDVFGYDWLDEDVFYAYVADVAGHGIGAALLGVSLVNHLRLAIQQREPWLKDPGKWLQHLNETFPMEQHGGLTWTLWCGIYHAKKRQLHYSSGGHPPAILINKNRTTHLSTNGPVLGALPDLKFKTDKVHLTPGAKLFLYTDGTFEFPLADASLGSIDQFTETVASTANMTTGECSYLHQHAATLCGSSHFPDDFTLLSLRFS